MKIGAKDILEEALTGKNFLSIVSLWFPVIFWCFIIFFLSSIPNLRIEAFGIWDLILRKIGHLVEFSILAGLMLRAIKGTIRNRVYFWSGFLSIVYAITDEYHQFYTPGRYPAITDVIIDSIGIAIALCSIKRYRSKMKRIEGMKCV